MDEKAKVIDSSDSENPEVDVKIMMM